MKLGSLSAEKVLVVANLLVALGIGAAFMTRESGAAADADQDPSPRLLVVVAADSPTDSAIGQPVADATGNGTLLALAAAGLTDTMTADLTESKPNQVLIIGGPAAVSDATAAALGRYTSSEVTRLFGADRYTTAAKVATTQFRTRVRQVRIRSGEAGVVPPSGQELQGSVAPLLLVERDRIPPPTAAALRQLRPRAIEILGGPAVVSELVVQQLQSFTRGEVVRRP